MAARRTPAPRCIVIAGPNGAGKTTFAREFLPNHTGVMHFVNADLIAAGLSPLKPDAAAIAAGRLFLRELDRLAGSGMDFGFESTLSGVGLANRIRQWKAKGYRIEIVYLALPAVELAMRRVAERVKQGGHDVPQQTILRRFARSPRNFQNSYRPLADSWMVFDSSGSTPRLIERGP